MPSLRQSIKKRRSWIILLAAAVLAAVAIADWTRPAREQISVQAYERAVINPYRRLVRPLVKGFVRCRFRPTCSQYSVEAVRAHGFPKGTWLTVKRVVRCGPWVPFGTSDPVPLPAS